MLKYFKEYLSDYGHSSTIQTIVLFSSIAFFVGLVYLVLNKPKKYYKETSELPLEDDDPML